LPTILGRFKFRRNLGILVGVTICSVLGCFRGILGCWYVLGVWLEWVGFMGLVGWNLEGCNKKASLTLERK